MPKRASATPRTQQGVEYKHQKADLDEARVHFMQLEEVLRKVPHVRRRRPAATVAAACRQPLLRDVVSRQRRRGAGRDAAVQWLGAFRWLGTFRHAAGEVWRERQAWRAGGVCGG